MRIEIRGEKIATQRLVDQKQASVAVHWQGGMTLEVSFEENGTVKWTAHDRISNKQFSGGQVRLPTQIDPIPGARRRTSD